MNDKFANFPEQQGVIRYYPHYHHSVPSGAIREGDFKLIEFFDDGHLELYNVRTDISETQNIAAQMPDKAHALHEKLKA